MKIAIMTRGRVGRVYTYDWIPEKYRADTYIVCPYFEMEGHKEHCPGVNVISEGEIALNYSQKFHNIVNGVYPELGSRIIIMDDDLKFSMRLNGSNKLVTASMTAMENAFHVLGVMMETYPLCGLHPRALGNNAPPGISEIVRVNALQAINRDLIGEVKLDYWPVLADIVLGLTLLTRGQKTAVFNNVLWDQQRGSNAEGGCSLYRTPLVQAEAVVGLAAMFPAFVSVVRKRVKAGWFGKDMPRVDFVIYWKRAYRHGLYKRDNPGRTEEISDIQPGDGDLYVCEN